MVAFRILHILVLSSLFVTQGSWARDLPDQLSASTAGSAGLSMSTKSQLSLGSGLAATKSFLCAGGNQVEDSRVHRVCIVEVSVPGAVLPHFTYVYFSYLEQSEFSTGHYPLILNDATSFVVENGALALGHARMTYIALDFSVVSTYFSEVSLEYSSRSDMLSSSAVPVLMFGESPLGDSFEFTEIKRYSNFPFSRREED